MMSRQTYPLMAAAAAILRLANSDNAMSPEICGFFSSTSAWRTDQCDPQTFPMTSWRPLLAREIIKQPWKEFAFDDLGSVRSVLGCGRKMLIGGLVARFVSSLVFCLNSNYSLARESKSLKVHFSWLLLEGAFNALFVMFVRQLDHKKTAWFLRHRRTPPTNKGNTSTFAC